MFKRYQGTILNTRLLNQMSYPDPITSRGQVRVRDKLGTVLESYFVIEVRRERLLPDVMDQLWRREKRELMKPLKVRMGMDEGEEGIDHGGVQQEFFRVAIAEIMNPDYGMFVIDEQSRMAWFRPCSLEPLYKFELVGLLFSLAIYNGLTLPVNFPLAFYRKLQGLPVKSLSHVEDGWPALAKGLQSLLDWSDGDVADVFTRTYDFDVEGPWMNVTVDMHKIGRDDAWVPAHLDLDYFLNGYTSTRSNSITVAKKTPGCPKNRNAKTQLSGQDSEEVAITTGDPRIPESEVRPAAKSSVTSEAAMVTNTNREQYVSDHIFWLTDKSIRPQFEAFGKTFFTCISRRAPELLTVSDFKRLVEGTQDVTVDDLRRIATYEGGYTWDHPTIHDFWDAVQDFSPEQIRLLLEFVTASDRIPAAGVASVSFTVQKNGEGDERLPTSITCYGKLLLPAYSCKEALREKLGLAIENCKGFGVQ
ncbi:MAG: hypothetical protein Q9170_004832 [Blastenia crenularia]